MEQYPQMVDLIRFFFIAIALIGLVFFVIIPLFKSGLPEPPPSLLQRKKHMQQKNLEGWLADSSEEEQMSEKENKRGSTQIDEKIKKATDVVAVAKKDPKKTAHIIQKWLKDS